jgi:hypothetical protein
MHEQDNTVLKSRTRMQRVSGFFSTQYRPKPNVEQTPPPSAAFKSEWICTSPSACLHGIRRNNFKFKFLKHFLPHICGPA